MRGRKLFFLLSVLCFAFFRQASAQTDDNVEERALEIADRLYCTVCSDANIEQASDEMANDLKFFIRRQLKEGKSADLVFHSVLANYEDIVVEHVAQPPAKDDPVWFSAVMSFLFFAAMAFYVLQRSKLYRAARENVGDGRK